MKGSGILDRHQDVSVSPPSLMYFISKNVNLQFLIEQRGKEPKIFFNVRHDYFKM